MISTGIPAVHTPDAHARARAPRARAIDVALVTFYDPLAYGARLLAGIAREQGCRPHLLHLKRQTGFIPLLRDKDGFESYQYYFNGVLRGGNYAVDPVRPAELRLLLDRLAAIRPAAICLSARTFAGAICAELAAQIRGRLPGVPIVAGGWGPTLEPERFLELADYVCIGEGEAAMAEICQALAAGRGFDEVTNLAYRRGGETRFNPLAAPLDAAAMGRLPLPNYEQLDEQLIAGDAIRPFDGGPRHRGAEGTYYCFSSRGCPMRCSYCMAGRLRDVFAERSSHRCPTYRLRALDDVFAELRNARAKGARRIYFKDEVFPFDAGFVAGFLARYPAEVGLPFFAYVRPEFHPPATVRALHRVGLVETTIGIQSGAEEIRQRIYRRRLPKEKLIAFAELIHGLGIDFHYHFIFRNPFETEAHLEESLRFTYELPYGKTVVFKLALFPGSPLEQLIRAERPVPLPRKLADWYALLHCLSLRGPRCRALARWIHRRRALTAFPTGLALPFTPYLLAGLGRTLAARLRVARGDATTGSEAR